MKITSVFLNSGYVESGRCSSLHLSISGKMVRTLTTPEMVRESLREAFLDYYKSTHEGAPNGVQANCKTKKCGFSSSKGGYKFCPKCGKELSYTNKIVNPTFEQLTELLIDFNQMDNDTSGENDSWDRFDRHGWSIGGFPVDGEMLMVSSAENWLFYEENNRGALKVSMNVYKVKEYDTQFTFKRDNPVNEDVEEI